jgi:hypothetical protein
MEGSLSPAYFSIKNEIQIRANLLSEPPWPRSIPDCDAPERARDASAALHGRPSRQIDATL